MWFTRVSIQNPVFATMLMLALVVLGTFSYQRLKVDQFPDVEFPTVVASLSYPGASPEIVESEVTQKVEEALNTIAGISALYSRSYEGTSVVIVEFNLNMDGRKAAEEVREKLSLLKPLLRTEVKDPRVQRFDPASRPIFTAAVVSPDGSKSPVELSTVADQLIKKRLETVPGVGAVNVVGAVRRQINIYLKPAAMEAYGVSVDQVLNAVRGENQDAPAGVLRTARNELVVQIDARIKRPEDFRRLIVAKKGAQGNIPGTQQAGGGGTPVRLENVAEVVDGPQELESLALFNGQRTIALDVQKSQGENTIEVIDGLKKAIADMQPELQALSGGAKAAGAKPAIAVEVVRDSGRPIRVSVNNVRQTMIEGALLTVLIVFLFLNSWRSTVITGLTLPISIIGTFLFMYAFGFTINVITLMALSLCVGLLIDDAIVVRENIVRHVQMGKPARQASLDGTQEIGLAVLATTLSIVAVFLPIGFMGGIIGKFFHEFGITIVAAVLISMFVSFTLDPMLSSVWHDPTIHRQHQQPGRQGLYDRTLGRLTGWFERATNGLGDVYQAVLRWSLNHRLATLALALGTLVAAFGTLRLVGTEFVPKADNSETLVSFYTPVGSSLEVTEAKAKQVEAILREFKEVRYTVATVNTGFQQGKIYASIYARLIDRKDRSLSVDALSAQLRERLARVPGITVTHVGTLDGVAGQKSIVLSMQGPDLPELTRLARQALEQVRQVPGVVDLDSTLKDDKPVMAVRVNRDAASDAGVSVAAIASSLRNMVEGTNVGSWRAPDDETYDINVRVAPSARETADDLARLPLMAGVNADGSSRVIRVGQVADLVQATGPNQINRRDLTREVEITANVQNRASGEVSADIRKVLEGMALPPGYRFLFGGSTKNMQESFAYAVSALALAVIFIYMILASQFKSFLQPLALMSSLPLTLIGVVLALLMFGSTLNMFSVIGIVMLMGLVTKNAILLVDFAIRAREGLAGGHGPSDAQAGAPMGRTEALLLAAQVRLRPILMTTLAMVFGMVPLAFALSEGAEQRAPMGQAVIGGVITSSVLTLVVVPVIYCYLDDLAQWARKLFSTSPTFRPAE
jgi:HAE1 family hydrophobic/amphiphilic exporter-1